ncbi:MAG: hypothetical protein AMXMBFR46_00240 [Acidimicrobiia bacterium]
MGEHQFDSDPDALLDYQAMVDDARTHTTEWLAAARDQAVREQRRWRLRELAWTRVLDERGKVDDSLAGRDGTRLRDVQRRRRTARNLEHQPHLADAAAEGRLSDEQLDVCSDLAGGDPDADRRWATEGPGWSPEDLADQLRKRRKPTPQDGADRRAARELRFWWRRDAGMLDGRFSLPDIDGALFESVLNQMIDRMRPTKGQPWQTRPRRGADALVELCRNYAHVEAPATPTPHFVVQIPPEGPATIAGIPLPDEMVESLRAQARIEPVLLDHHGQEIARGRARSTVSPKIQRAVRLRDGKCRWPGCDRRTGLQVHHLWPASWGGGDQQANLACVCTGGSTDHHAQLVPHGPMVLLGYPHRPDGLTLIHRDDLAALAELAAAQPRQGTEARAGPEAA